MCLMPHKNINIIIADDHTLFRQALRSLLAQYADISITGEAANGEELLRVLNSCQAHIVLLDVHMPIMSGVEALDVLRTRFPDIKVIIISSDFSPFLLTEYTKKGVHGFLPKGCDTDILIEAIHETMAKGNSLAISKALIQKNHSPFTNPFQLTEKEMQVLSHTSKGLSNKDIASTMHVAERTVEFHKTNIYTKTGSKSLADMIAYGIKNGLDKL